jgi:hypothetical protein
MAAMPETIGLIAGHPWRRDERGVEADIRCHRRAGAPDPTGDDCPFAKFKKSDGFLMLIRASQKSV